MRKPHQCDQCAMMFHSSISWTNHMKYFIHEGERSSDGRFQCVECGAYFTLLSQLKSHQYNKVCQGKKSQSDNEDIIVVNNFDSDIDITENKIDLKCEEDNAMINSPTQVNDDQRSDVVKSETLENLETEVPFNLDNDSNCELMSIIEIEQHKLEPVSEEHNVSLDFPAQDIKNLFKSEALKIEESVASTSQNHSENKEFCS